MIMPPPEGYEPLPDEMLNGFASIIKVARALAMEALYWRQRAEVAEQELERLRCYKCGGAHE